MTTLLTMSFSARPFQPSSKALPSNGLPPYLHTPSTTSTPSPTCLLLTSPAAAHIKPQSSLFLTLDKNKTRHYGLSSTASVRLPSAHHTLTRRWYFSVWHSLSNLAPSPTTSTYTHLPPCMEEMQTLHTKFCNDYTPSAATPLKQTPHASHQLHRRWLPWRWSPTGWPHGHHGWIGKLCR